LLRREAQNHSTRDGIDGLGHNCAAGIRNGIPDLGGPLNDCLMHCNENAERDPEAAGIQNEVAGIEAFG
jgi:hypothetical protein